VAVGGEVEETVARVGGGALPLAEVPSYACAVEEALAGLLREGEPPIVGIVRDGRLLLDCRTLTDAEADEVATTVALARRAEAGAAGEAEAARAGGDKAVSTSSPPRS
jgi:L-seryl-tRNA(Ser) seleniumtransferase